MAKDGSESRHSWDSCLEIRDCLGVWLWQMSDDAGKREIQAALMEYLVQLFIVFCCQKTIGICMDRSITLLRKEKSIIWEYDLFGKN